MRWITHLIWALVFAKILGTNSLITMAFSLLPDIDLHPKVFYKLGHRTYTHSLLFLFLFLPFNSVFVGILSHLILDMLNPTGIKLLYPLRPNFIILNGFIPTGTIKEIFFALIGIILVII